MRQSSCFCRECAERLSAPSCALLTDVAILEGNVGESDLGDRHGDSERLGVESVCRGYVG